MGDKNVRYISKADILKTEEELKVLWGELETSIQHTHSIMLQIQQKLK